MGGLLLPSLSVAAMPKNKGKGGKNRKKVWINQGDIVLLSLRDFQDDKADVIQKYSSDEARKLKQYGGLPETAKINEGPTEEDGEGLDVVEFDEVSADEDDDDDDERKDDDFDIDDI